MEPIEIGNKSENLYDSYILSRNVEGSNNQDLSVNVGTSASFCNVLHGNTISAMDVDVTVNGPFALVDEISEASLAAEDGLQLGDQIVKFGNVESGDDLLPKLASEALPRSRCDC
ncbi:hypothetical protein LOK49_LG08G03222 [Camellia lanceoleosa]|uniref:Uncharacterized protein n=1 Tax=Camellia lanceoleosa TaxID=1840588 RepID=A0ACC0GUW3_9ERIC|nr:hypothetical protein LOK49_LG08G03222 [Camellia lanceoleosa]